MGLKLQVMAVSTLRPRSDRRKLCVGILAALGLLSQVLRCRSALEVASTSSWVDCFKQVLWSSPGENAVNSYTLLETWFCDDTVARECAPSIGNFTCSLYAAPNGYGTCLLDDPEVCIASCVLSHRDAGAHSHNSLRFQQRFLATTLATSTI